MAKKKNIRKPKRAFMSGALGFAAFDTFYVARKNYLDSK